MLIQEQDAIVYRETPLNLPLRLFILVLAAGLTIVVPAPFLIHADWTSFSPTLLLAAACIAFAVSVGIFFLVVALVSATELRLDGRTGQAVRILRGPVVNRRDCYPLSQFGEPDVSMRESSEDGPYPILTLKLPTGGALTMACFADRAEAELWRGRIATLLSART
jgi:hypothetical protein